MKMPQKKPSVHRVVNDNDSEDASDDSKDEDASEKIFRRKPCKKGGIDNVNHVAPKRS